MWFSLNLQPLQTRTQPPTESWRVVILQVNFLAQTNNVETEEPSTVSHCDTGHWYDWDDMSFAYDTCSGRDRCSIRYDFRRELVEEEGICKESWSTLIGLSVAYLDAFGSVEHFVRYRCCSAHSAYFSSWKCPPAKEEFLSCCCNTHFSARENIEYS